MQNNVLITGSAGLIGSEATLYFANKGFKVVGVDNDLRAHCFGASASTSWNRKRLEEKLGANYIHCSIDIRDGKSLEGLFKE